MAGGWTGMIGLGLRGLLARRISMLSDFEGCGARAGGDQRRALQRMMTRAKDTRFGREHGFASALRSGSDNDVMRAYRAAVPIREYPGFAAWFREMRDEGAPDVCWPGVVRDWAQTSGTTAGDKYMPVSRELLRHNFRSSLDIFAHASRFGVSLRGLFGGRILFLGGSSDLSVNEHGIRTGDLSGVVTQLIRWPMTEVYLPGREVALMHDWPAKIEAMARLCVDADVRCVSGMPSWGLVLFNRVLELARERGRKADCLRDVWPEFRLLIHGGVKYAPFDARVREAWSGGDEDVPARVELYPASEAFVAIQDTLGDPGLRLNADLGVFYEFVPVEEIGSDDARAFACDEVEKGQRYVVVLTTPAGLWRYVLGDVVEFDTIPPEGPARLRIVGRHRLFINAFGENLIVEHIENAVAEASRETGVRVGEFTAAPVYPDLSRGVSAGLELAVEIESKEWSAEAFRAAFDRSIRAQNVDYNTKRGDDVGMGPPTITALEPGTIHRWMESRGKLGGQHKCPRCANHREFVEGVLGVMRAV